MVDDATLRLSAFKSFHVAVWAGRRNFASFVIPAQHRRNGMPHQNRNTAPFTRPCDRNAKQALNTAPQHVLTTKIRLAGKQSASPLRARPWSQDEAELACVGEEHDPGKDDTHACFREGTAYPGVLLTAGINDPRVDPAQPAKMTAPFAGSNG
jgi:hypothetical protein